MTKIEAVSKEKIPCVLTERSNSVSEIMRCSIYWNFRTTIDKMVEKVRQYHPVRQWGICLDALSLFEVARETSGSLGVLCANYNGFDGINEFSCTFGR